MSWAEDVCRIPFALTAEDATALQVFEVAAPHLGDDRLFVNAVSEWLRQHPDLIDAWNGYSQDKRASPSPYFEMEGNSSEVGFYADGARDVKRYADKVDACADFIHREAEWVLHEWRVTASGNE